MNATLVKEEWRPVVGWESLYEVSNFGRVRSISVTVGIESRYQWRRGSVMQARLGRKGYPQLRLSGIDGSEKTLRVHTLVAQAFIGPRPSGMQINHKDGCKTNNTPDNLEYVTCGDNIRHGWENGLYSGEHQRGEKNTFAKLTAEDVIAIRRLDTEMTRDGLAEMYGVSSTTISHIVNRKTWKHI